MLEHDSIKAIAVEAGMSLSNAGKWAAYLGFRKHWLTDDEWREVSLNRKKHEQT